MRVLVVPMEVPLPANSGGRIDVSRRLRLLRDHGHETALLTWHNIARDGALPAEAGRQLAALCNVHHVSLIRRSGMESLRRVAHLWHWPSHVAARWVTLDKAAVLRWARDFRPDVLLLDGLYGVAAVRWLARMLGVPWVYRSHNIEHLYMRQQRDQTHGRKTRLALSVNLLGLHRVEAATVRDAGCVYDISPDDAAYWRREGHRHVHWLPTVVDADFEAAMQAAGASPPQWDIVYFGNLNTPNNVQAVDWLLRRVLPLLQHADLRVALAGSRPSDAVRRLAAEDPRVVLLADPPSIPAIAGAARVLVNPVPSSSGVNLKSVEMLFSQAALVSTPAGVQGLPPEATSCFAVHAEAEPFARAITDALSSGVRVDAATRRAARAPFAPAGAARVLNETLQPLLRHAAA